MTLNAKERQKRRRQKRLKRRANKSSGRQGNGFDIPPGVLIAHHFEGVKMSEILLDFADPLLADGLSLNEYRSALMFASVVWNAAAIGDTSLIKELKASFDNMGAEDAGVMNSMFHFLYARRQTHFADVDRLIVDIIVEDRGDDFYVKVMSSLLDDPETACE